MNNNENINGTQKKCSIAFSFSLRFEFQFCLYAFMEQAIFHSQIQYFMDMELIIFPPNDTILKICDFNWPIFSIQFKTIPPKKELAPAYSCTGAEFSFISAIDSGQPIKQYNKNTVDGSGSSSSSISTTTTCRVAHLTQTSFNENQTTFSWV